LQPQVPEPLLHETPAVVHYLFRILAIYVDVDLRGLAAFAAQHVVDRHTGLTALDVPQRLIHAADGINQHWSVAPVGTVVHGLPEVSIRSAGFADHTWLEVLLHREIEQLGALG
jgi:hypothetical protein